MYTIGPGLWQGKGKTCKMRHTHCRTWNMVKKMTNREKEKLTQQDMQYGEKH